MDKDSPVKPTRDTDAHPPSEDQKLVKKIKNYIYDPSELIGSGFSSHVFKGINELTSETIAIKVLQLSKIQNQVEKYLLNNEINALRALTHPNILRTIEILMTKNNVYIMTQFCEKGDLQQFIKRSGKLQQMESLLIIRDVIEGYKAIEQKNIIHRDMKTANIFLTSTGARIADFGFCEFLGDKKPQIAYNVGSPAYMSPESYKQNLYSHKSDIWSVGIILYEMLVGETPDKNLTYTEMVNNLMAGRINNVSEGIREILKRCFKKDLKDRCSARELMEMVYGEISRTDRNKGFGGIQPVQVIQQLQPFQSQFITMPLQPPPPPHNQQIVTNSGLSTASQKFLAKTSGQHPQSQNKHVIVSQPPIEDQANGRSQSPYKLRFKKEDDSNEVGGRLVPAFSVQMNNPSKFKPHIQTLLFLFRLLKYVSDSPIALPSHICLLLFRHRTHLQSLLQPVSEYDRSLQTYKEFQYLKSKFDELYLQGQMMRRQSRSDGRGGMDTQVLVEGIKECDAYVGRSADLYQSGRGNTNTNTNFSDEMGKVGLLWDYLMLQYEAILLHNTGNSVQIVSDRLHFESTMKEQPRKLTLTHFQLLRIKWRTLLETGSVN